MQLKNWRAGGFALGRSQLLVALGVAVAVGVLVLGTLSLLSGRNDAWRQARQSANNLLLALDRDITRNIHVLDLSLIGVGEALAEPGIDAVSSTIRQHTLFDRSATADDLGSILVLDPHGHVVADSTSLEPHRLELADRDYFRVHQERSGAGLFVSRVFPSRLDKGDLRFAISRRLDGTDGAFAGVVSATLRLVYLQRLFEKLDIGKQGTITLIRDDGRVLYRYPFRLQDLDLDLSQGNLNYARFRAAKSGQYVALAGIDGIERLYSFRHLGDLPLILTVSLSTDEVLSPWRRKAMVIGPVMVLLCTSSVLSALLFRREMIRRARSEEALAELAERFRVQSLTDGLTGLLNRRALDTELDREFRNAVRRGTTLSVLMMDADHFKRFNDTYGHAAGDEALRALAVCLRDNLRRACDTAARYGGEEFAAILPDTDANAAMELAERVRHAVRQLAIPHSASPSGAVTVSIGIAAVSPKLGDHAEMLLGRADESLYEAKRTGRDKVLVHTTDRLRRLGDTSGELSSASVDALHESYPAA